MTPELLRSIEFPRARDGEGLDPRQVHEFLEQVASSLEVLGSMDVVQAMRKELVRNSEISSRVVLAGQETAERLRQQAADDARTIIEDTKAMAEQLRDAARAEVERTRSHVGELRAAFIDELRDLYDRIGATLYRFETASRAGAPVAAAPAGAPLAAPAVEQGPAVWDESELAPVAPEAIPEVASAPAATEPAIAQSEGWGDLDAWSPEEPAEPQERAPAWTQLPTEAYATTSGEEPLVDLRPMQQAMEAEGQAGAEPQEAMQPGEPNPVEEDRRAEALLEGMDAVLGAADAPTQDASHAAPVEPHTPVEPHIPVEQHVPVEQHTPTAPHAPAVAIDMDTLRAFVLQAIHDGQPREAVEAYLRDNFDVADPGPLITALLEGATPPQGP